MKNICFAVVLLSSISLFGIRREALISMFPGDASANSQKLVSGLSVIAADLTQSSAEKLEDSWKTSSLTCGLRTQKKLTSEETSKNEESEQTEKQKKLQAYLASMNKKSVKPESKL